jgi:SAM-dependent methyltransferase
MSLSLPAPNPSSWVSHSCELVGTWSLSPNRHCLDLRSAEAYSEAHLVPSTSIPLDTLESRFSQLPPKNAGNSFLVVTHKQALLHDLPVGELLTARGWRVDGVIELPQVSMEETAIEKFWEYTGTMGVFGSGKEGAELLFKPSPVLGAWIDWIEEDIAVHNPPLLACSALDFGCGSGRDMGFLVAREFPWSVNGLDSWEKALERAEIMVKSINPSLLNRLIHAKIDDESGVITPLSTVAQNNLKHLYHYPADLILIIRFFPRHLFGQIYEFLRPGGYLIFSHFTDPQSGMKDYDSPPRDKRVQPGEVEDMLVNADIGWAHRWEIMQAAYSSSEDGRPMWDIVAKLG